MYTITYLRRALAHPVCSSGLDLVVVTAEGIKVAIEVDGPSHFVGSSGQPTGATMLKRRQLRAAG